MLQDRAVSQAALAARVPPEIRETLATRGIYCDADDMRLFRFAPAVTGLNGRLSRNPTDCAGSAAPAP
jgi:hypothetical protein